jgi:dihydroorotase
MKLLIKNGHIVDPANNLDGVSDILVQDSKIYKVSKNIEADVDFTIDATGKLVLPGLVDMHVHLREPGREDKETIETATQAAFKGGVTSLLAMPNTQPPIDSTENVKLLRELIIHKTKANVFICATITKGREGRELTDIAALKQEGILAISDDGDSVEASNMLLEALEKANKVNVLVICHCEDKSLSKKGVVNLGFISTCLGLRGIPKEAEYKRVQRDIQLAEKLGTPLHMTHVSCQESVELIACAKKKNIKVSADTCPHYFALTEEAVSAYNTNAKINPPLRTKEDVAAIKEGLKSGIIDAIASDHAPHTENEKEIEFEYAEFGTIGLETELALGIIELVGPGILNWSELVRKMALNPAKILGIDKGTLGEGKDADIIVVAPEEEWMVRKEDMVSKSKNSAFLGYELKGVVEHTICAGEIVYKNQNEIYPHQRTGKVKQVAEDLRV